jgi:hypothetical protein
MWLENICTSGHFDLYVHSQTLYRRRWMYCINKILFKCVIQKLNISSHKHDRDLCFLHIFAKRISERIRVKQSTFLEMYRFDLTL